MNTDAPGILEAFGPGVAEDAKKIFFSTRNRHLKFTGDAFEVMNPTNNRLISMKGVTKVLKKYAWPDFNMAELDENIAFLPHELRGTPTPKGVSSVDGVGIGVGRNRGKRVHTEIEKIVHGHHESIDFQKHEFHEHTEAVMKFIADPSKRKLSPETIAYGLGKDKWIVLASEFHLFDEDSFLASGIDIVCINMRGEMCFIELKVGHSLNWHATCGFMRGAAVALSPLNMALVQVGFYGIMASRKYDVRNVRMVVLNVNYAGVQEFVVTPSFLVQSVAPIYAYVGTSILRDKALIAANREAEKEERKRLKALKKLI